MHLAVMRVCSVDSHMPAVPRIWQRPLPSQIAGTAMYKAPNLVIFDIRNLVSALELCVPDHRDNHEPRRIGAVHAQPSSS
jgi:hypothetical protein